MRWNVEERAEGWRVRDNNGDLAGEPQATCKGAVALLVKLRDAKRWRPTTLEDRMKDLDQRVMHLEQEDRVDNVADVVRDMVARGDWPPPPPPEGPPNETVREDNTVPIPPSLDEMVRMVPENKPKRRLPKKVRHCIKAALKRADSKLRKGCGVDPKAQELMRIYLDTWVAGPLHEILKWDEGDDGAYLDWS